MIFFSSKTINLCNYLQSSKSEEFLVSELVAELSLDRVLPPEFGVSEKRTERKTERPKFMFSKKATKIGELFTVDLTSCSKCQIDSEDFVDFCGLLRKQEL